MAPPTFVVDQTRTAKCPELLCLTPALLVSGWRPAPPRRALPLLLRFYKLMRQTRSLLRIRVSTLHSAVLAGCCEPLLGTGSSRRYLRNSFLSCLVLNPDGPTKCTCLFLPGVIGLPWTLLRSAYRSYPRTRFSAVKFRGCHRTFLSFKPPSLLVSQIAPTATNFAGRPRLLHPGTACFVTSARTGYAIRLIQAIDGERTFTFLDLRPCRLLQGPTFINCTARPRLIRPCDLFIPVPLQHTLCSNQLSDTDRPSRRTLE